MAGGLILFLWMKVLKLEGIVQIISTLSEVLGIVKESCATSKASQTSPNGSDESQSESSEDESAKKSRYLRVVMSEVSDPDLWVELHYPQDPPELAEMRASLRARRAQLEEEWDEAESEGNTQLMHHIDDQIRLLDCL